MAINFLFDVSVNSGIDLQNTSITSLATPVNNTDAATKAYVDALVTASDLDFSGTTGTGAVDLDSQVFAVTGGTFISTAASGQSLSIDLNATGSPSVNTFLRGDNTWSTPPDNNTTYTFAAVSGTPNLIRLTGTNPSSTNDIGLVATGNIAITFNSATSLGFDLASSISVANTITAGTGLTVTTGGVDVTGTGTFNTGVSVTGDSSINGELDMSSNKIINVTDPTNAQDAATKNYVDITSTSGAVNFQGGYDAATNTPDLDSNPSSAIKRGWMYTVTADGTFFTEQVRTGDSLIAQIDAPTTLANWTTVQNNIDLADASTVGIGNVAGTTNDINVVYSAGTATISQAAVTLNQNTSSVTPGSGGSFTAIDSVTTNSTGHLTDYNLKTITLPTATVSGSGTANYISKWNTTSALTDSLIYDTGTQLAIGTTTPDSGVILQVGDGTVSEIIRVYDSGNKHIDLKGEGVLFTRNNSYLRPSGTAASQTLYIGDNFGGTNPNRSWGAIRSNFNDFWFTDNGVKVMRIHNEKVGIGTGAVYPNTASEKLHVDGNFRLTGSFKDGSNGAGTSGQVLSSTGTSTSWITLPTDNNNYVTSASFDTTTGVLTLSRQGLTAITESLDGRYLTGNQNIELTGDVTGGPSATSIATTISSNVVGANELNVSSNGTSGQVLTSDGLGAFTWTTPVTGDIEGVTAGNGLTGGGTAGTVSLAVGQGTGIQVNATNVALATAGPGAGTYGSTSDSTKIDTITLDAYGRVTSVATGATGNISGSGTTNYIPKWTFTGGLTNSIIYDNGSVGIGTTSPGSKLTVRNSGPGNSPFRVEDSGGVVLMNVNEDSLGNAEVRLNNSSGTQKVRLDTSGNSYFTGGKLGIGTGAPSTTLHVAGSSIIANSTVIDPDTYGNTVIAGGIADGSGWAVNSAIGGNAGAGNSWAIGTNTNNLYMGYGDQANANSLQTFLQVNGRNVGLVPTSGSVGVGTTSPSEKLQVNGNIRLDSGVTNQIGIISYGVNGKIGQTTSWTPDTGSNPGLWVEGSNDGESGGIFMNGNTFALWSPGDQGILKIYDEDNFSQGPLYQITGFGHSEGQRFASIANNAYYLDPDGDSQLNTLDIDDYVRHRGDTNTYIGFPANDTFNVTTGNSERIRVTSNGKVGINTSVPEAKFAVFGGSLGSTAGDSVTHAQIRGDRHRLDFKEVRTNTGSDWNNTTYKLQMRVDSTDHQSIDFVSDSSYAEHIDIYTGNQVFNTRFSANGNVGIGTTTLGSKLNVEGNAEIGTANTAGTYAVAIGNANSAGGEDSLAQGHLTDASGFAAAAFNYDTTALGGASAAFGALTTASGANSFAAGGNSTAGGVESAVFGTDNTIGSNAKASLSAGEGNTTNGPYNFTVGLNNNNNGGNTVDGFGGNIIGGKYNSITGSTTNGALAMGNGNSITSSSSACFGGGNGVHASATVAIGIGNATISSQPTYGQNGLMVGFQNQSQFGDQSIVGGYQSDGFGINSIAFGLGATSSTGNQQFAFGKGVTTPTSSTAAYMDNQFVVGRYNSYSTSGVGHLFAVGSGSGSTSRTNALNVIGTGTYTTGQLSINSTTGYSSSTYNARLHVAGYATKTTGSSWVSVSDERLKSNIEVYEKGLSEVLQITPKTFEFNGKAGTQTGQSQVGIVAQEIKDILPESINVFTAKLEDTDETETELYDFNQDPLIYTLLNAVKELSAKIDTLENRIQTLEGN